MKKLIFNVLVASLILFSGACDTTDNIGGDNGRLIIKITDDPFDISYIESASVTITKIEIRKADDSEDYPFIVISEDTLSYDLVNLRNGITEDMLNIDIPEGNYDLIRLYVSDASLKIKDIPNEFKVKVPSGTQTGIKIFITPVLQVEGGLTSELLLDFNLSRSFVMRGNLNTAVKNGFIFKPVIRASNLSSAGRIEGIVSDSASNKIANAEVWIEQDSVISTSYTDTVGYYALIGIPAGTYSIFATKENFDTIQYSDLKVVAGNRVIQNLVLHEQ